MLTLLVPGVGMGGGTASAPVFTGTIPDITEPQNTGSYTFQLGTYFSLATSYAISPSVQSGWTFDTSTAQFVITTEVAGVFGPYTVTGTNGVGSTPSNAFSVTVVAAGSDAGRPRRRRQTIYFVKIDGETFECRSYEAAIALLEKAQKTAQELADRTIAEAIATQEKEAVEVPVPKIKMPEIKASSRELRKEITQTKRAIASTYERAMRDAEIALLFALTKRKQQDEDEELFWLY